jgi:hypothetical protein
MGIPGYGTSAGAPTEGQPAGDDLYAGYNDYNALIPQAPEGDPGMMMPPGTGMGMPGTAIGMGAPGGAAPMGMGMGMGMGMPPGTAMRGMLPPGTGAPPT